MGVWFSTFTEYASGDALNQKQQTVDLKGTYDVFVTCHLSFFQAAPPSGTWPPKSAEIPSANIVISGYEKGGTWTYGSWYFLMESGVTQVQFTCDVISAWTTAVGLVQST